MRTVVLAAATVALVAATASADRPSRNISARRHPNLASAQRFIQQAFDKVEAAQRANEWDLGGHAKKAKELLEKASEELKEAALEANAR